VFQSDTLTATELPGQPGVYSILVPWKPFRLKVTHDDYQTEYVRFDSRELTEKDDMECNRQGRAIHFIDLMHFTFILLYNILYDNVYLRSLQ